EGYDSLKVRHAEGASGQESVRTHARLMDDVIFSLTRLIAADAAADGLEATPLVVMALGGYGRGELHPLSDVDLMVVYDGEMSPYVQRMMQELLYSLWDLGLHVGHSLRSLDDCVAMARTDFPSRTSMQEARFLAGDRRLFARFQRVLRQEVFRRDFGQFLETTLVERDARYRKHGASPYIGEPNVKESAGGLRALPGNALASRLRRAPPAAAGARGRPRVLRRAAPPRRPRPLAAAGGSGAPHEGLRALAPVGLRAVARPRARGRGLAPPRGRRVPPVGRGGRALPRHLPELGARVPDVLGDARAGAPRPLSTGVRRADVPRAVRRLPQVLRGSALVA